MYLQWKHWYEQGERDEYLKRTTQPADDEDDESSPSVKRARHTVDA